MNKQTLAGRIKAMKVGDQLSFSQQDAKHDSIVTTVYRINRSLGYKAYSCHVSKLTPLVTSIHRDA